VSQQNLFPAPALSGLAGVFNRAADDWGLNCGPGAICGALALLPDAVRPHLGKFEGRGFMAPGHMWAALRRLGVEYTLVRPASSCRPWPRNNGICRVQWSGPWCDPGRPAVAAYRHTHWVAARRSSYAGGDDWAPAGTGPVSIFDVNNIIGPGAELSLGSPDCPDGWLPLRWWADVVVPELLPSKGDGSWWVTHTAEVLR
jgi:hypothetical protein